LRTFKWPKGWIVLSVGLLLFGCATSEDVRILDEDIRQFQSELNRIRKEEGTLRRELNALRGELAPVQKKSQDDISLLRTETQTETQKLQSVQSDLLLRIETLQSEMRILSTGVEEYKDFLKRPSKEIDRLKGDVETRLRILEERWKGLEDKDKAADQRIKEIGDRLKGLESKVTELASKLSEFASKLAEAEKAAASKEPPVEVKGVSTGVGDLYKDAYETLQKGDLEAARRKFEAFLKQYPNTELSDNAQFWVGETYYLRKDFEKAILEYEKAIAKYPEGDKIPAALFKQALAFLELGDKTNARSLLKRVIERYPHSEQAEMAKKRLEGIK